MSRSAGTEVLGALRVAKRLARRKSRAARNAAKRPRSEAKPSEAWAPAKDGRRAKTSWKARAVLAAAAIAAIAGSAAAETGWVKDELRLNLRTGPGIQYRIKGFIKTGDSVAVLDRREAWVRVRTKDVGEGWIEDGFLSSQPPAAMRLAQTEAETAEFRGQFSSLSERVKELETKNAELSETDAAQRDEIQTLTRENLELRAGARWPEWITGAVILAAGMLMGAILQSVNGRRSRPRIRI